MIWFEICRTGRSLAVDERLEVIFAFPDINQINYDFNNGWQTATWWQIAKLNMW